MRKVNSVFLREQMRHRDFAVKAEIFYVVKSYTQAGLLINKDVCIDTRPKSMTILLLVFLLQPLDVLLLLHLYIAHKQILLPILSAHRR